MKFCQSHWDQLRQAIDARGLSHLIAKDGKEAVDRLTDTTTEPGRDAAQFDPLMGSYFRIMSRIMEIRGFMYMVEGAPCPMCEPDEANPNWANNWIEGVSDEALYNARLLGLMPPEGTDSPDLSLSSATLSA